MPKLKVGPRDTGFVFRGDGMVEMMLARNPTPASGPDAVVIAETLMWAVVRPDVMLGLIEAKNAELKAPH